MTNTKKILSTNAKNAARRAARGAAKQKRLSQQEEQWREAARRRGEHFVLVANVEAVTVTEKTVAPMKPRARAALVKALVTETAHELAPGATARVIAKRIAKQSSAFRTALAAALNIALPANATARANAATLAQAALVAVIGGRKNADLLALVLVQGATLAQLVKLSNATATPIGSSSADL